MKKITKILIAIAFLLTAISLQAQQSCATICHNGTLVIAIGTNAINGHLDHHVLDVLISTDCEYEIIGNECETLSLPKIDFYKPLPIGESYILYDISGRLIRIGIVESDLKDSLPIRGIYLLQIKGYQVLKLIH